MYGLLRRKKDRGNELHGVIGMLTFTPVVFILQYSEEKKKKSEIWHIKSEFGIYIKKSE